MAFKLVISDTVEIPVKFTVNDGPRATQFAFTLVGGRLPIETFTALPDTPDISLAEFLKEHITGWKGQRLVVDDNGTPAEFSLEAFDVMFSLVGMGPLAFQAYFEACGTRGKVKN